MGLLRLGVIAAVGIALLPSDSEQQEMLYNRAALAAKWSITFCDRNAQTCEHAASLWGEFSKKAQFAAKLAYETVSEQVAGDDAVSQQAAYTPTVYGSAKSGRLLETGTLKPADLEPSWRGRDGAKAAGRLPKN